MNLLELAEKVEIGESEKGFHYACELVREINEAGVPVTMAMVDGSIDAVEKLRAESLPNFYPKSSSVQNVCECEMVNFMDDHLDYRYYYGEAKTEALARLAALLRAVHAERENLDNCEICKGTKGGVKGNENIIDGVVMCDYCDAEKMSS